MPSPGQLRIGPACYHVLHLIPPMVAHEMNFFAEEGLVDGAGSEAYKLITGGLAPFTFEKEALQQGMKEKAIDAALDVHPSTVAYSRLQDGKQPRLTIIAGWRNNNPNCLIGDSSISSLEDLRGKRIGCIDEQDNFVAVLSPALQRSGIDLREVKWVRGYAPQKGATGLREGAVDAAFIPTIDVAPLLEDGYQKLFDIVQQYPGGRPDRIIVATEEALRFKRDALKSFLKGMLRAYWFVRAMPDNYQYLKNLEIRLRRESPDPDEASRPLVNKSPAHSEILPFPYDGVPTQLDAYLSESVELGELASAPAAESLCDFSMLREAFEELRGRADLKEDLERAKDVYRRWGF